MLLAWVNAISELTRGEVVAIDDKTARRAYARGDQNSAMHLVSAWACDNGLVLGQLKTEAKSNEIKAIPPLLELLAVQGCIVTIDAMGCQKEIAQAIRNEGADYVLVLKGNQGTLHEDVALFWDTHRDGEGIEYHETLGADHG